MLDAIVMDMDGTLLDPNNKILPEVFNTSIYMIILLKNPDTTSLMISGFLLFQECLIIFL